MVNSKHEKSCSFLVATDKAQVRGTPINLGPRHSTRLGAPPLTQTAPSQLEPATHPAVSPAIVFCPMAAGRRAACPVLAATVDLLCYGRAFCLTRTGRHSRQCVF